MVVGGCLNLKLRNILIKFTALENCNSLFAVYARNYIITNDLMRHIFIISLIKNTHKIKEEINKLN
jgi:hypothetical protein